EAAARPHERATGRACQCRAPRGQCAPDHSGGPAGRRPHAERDCRRTECARRVYGPRRALARTDNCERVSQGLGRVLVNSVGCDCPLSGAFRTQLGVWLAMSVLPHAALSATFFSPPPRTRNFQEGGRTARAFLSRGRPRLYHIRLRTSFTALPASFGPDKGDG